MTTFKKYKLNTKGIPKNFTSKNRNKKDEIKGGDVLKSVTTGLSGMKESAVNVAKDVKNRFTSKGKVHPDTSLNITALPNITTGIFAVKFIDDKQIQIQLGFCPIKKDFFEKKTTFTKVTNYYLKENEIIKAIKSKKENDIFVIAYDITSGKPEIYFKTIQETTEDGIDNDATFYNNSFELSATNRTEVLNEIITISTYIKTITGNETTEILQVEPIAKEYLLRKLKSSAQFVSLISEDKINKLLT